MDFAYYIMTPFTWLLMFFYNFFNSYGVALILFALVVKLILFPLSLKGKRSMIQMNMLSGKMQKLQKQYGKDQARYNEEVQKLYAKENVNPMGGCLWSMLPLLILLPLYVNFRYFDVAGLFQLIFGRPLNLLDTVAPFALLGITCTGLKNGLYIFMMRQYFRGLPKELEEAAYVDGAGTIKAFVRVFLASARQIMMTVFLFSFVWQWLDDIFTSVFLQNVPMLTTELFRLISNSAGVDAGISNLTEFSLMRNCGMLFLIIPMLILYLFCQRYFTESIERAGLVG